MLVKTLNNLKMFLRLSIMKSLMSCLVFRSSTVFNSSRNYNVINIDGETTKPTPERVHQGTVEYDTVGNDYERYEAPSDIENQSDTLLITDVPETVTGIQQFTQYSILSTPFGETSKVEENNDWQQPITSQITKQEYPSNILLSNTNTDDVSDNDLKSVKVEDNFKKLGEFVTATLRKLPPKIAAGAEAAIHQLLHAHSLQALRLATGTASPISVPSTPSPYSAYSSYPTSINSQASCCNETCTEPHAHDSNYVFSHCYEENCVELNAQDKDSSDIAWYKKPEPNQQSN